MMRTGLHGALALSLAIGLGCARESDERPIAEQTTVYGDQNVVPPRPIIVEGCLTAAGERFVLTELDRGVPGPTVAEERGARPWAEPEPTTEAYRLVGFEDQLRPLVGRRIEITGEAEPEHVVEARELTPVAPAPNTTGTSGPQPQVSTIATTRIAISDLRVRSVTSEGSKCVEGQ